MDEVERPKGIWWQTVPGILTALAGIVTAVAGLLLTLHQIGLLGKDEKPVSQTPSASIGTAVPSGVSTPTATRPKEADPSKPEHPSDVTKIAIDGQAGQYSVAFPSGTEVSVRSSRAEGVYKVLSAQVDRRNTGKLSLKISVRLTNMGRSDLGFWSDSFRLKIDGVARAPINFLNQLVDGRSAKEADVLFEVPDSAERLVLSVTGDGEDTADIAMLLKKLH